MKKKAVIFDMDGLMIDSERATLATFNAIFAELGYPPVPEERYQAMLGKKPETMLDLFYELYGKDCPAGYVWAESHKRIDGQFRNQVPKKKGLDILLKYLKENHYKTIVATSSARSRVDEILKHGGLCSCFDGSICGDEVACNKPHPEVFLTACEKLKVKPEEALVLEDSEAGIMAACRGHIDVICIPDMKYPEPEYAEKTKAVLNSLDEVIDYLEALKNLKYKEEES